VLAELPASVVAYIVDDGSAVAMVATASKAEVHVLRHAQNRGYGAAQKTGYAAALSDGAERIVLLHGDGQYDTAETLALAQVLDEAPAALGSRFLADPTVIPWWRRLGNGFLTGMANLRFGTAHTELHTGARAFRADVLRRLPLDTFSDDFVFDQQLLCALLRSRERIAERAVHAHYDETTRSISPLRSIIYALSCLREIAR
jgi:glycosyltransferase involved in cell wall biosynthesis